ncbi:uncharacterized protein LOC136031548 [Artemia franciscana]|uniref:uncharacterized protein LOC136031548 n=1 Tax=Artemia franciscana TaxID=6661 RepID=UPI0032DBC29B
MIGRADIEGSKCDVAINAWPPQASYSLVNFSDTSYLKLLKPKGSIGTAFAVRTRRESRDQASICSFALREVSFLLDLALGHLLHHLTDVPPQSNSPFGSILSADRECHPRPDSLDTANNSPKGFASASLRKSSGHKGSGI